MREGTIEGTMREGVDGAAGGKIVHRSLLAVYMLANDDIKYVTHEKVV